MGILSNFIGSAATAGGEIMQKQREADVAVQSQKTLAEYNNELALKREETIRRAREEQGIREAVRAGERITARDKELLDARLTEENRLLDPTHIKKLVDADKAKAQGILANRVALAPDAAAATEAEFAAGGKNREAVRKEGSEAATKTASEKATADLDFYNQNRSKILARMSDEARSKHIESAGSLAQAALAKMQMSGVKQTNELRQQLAEARASGNDDAVESIQQQITDLAYTGKDTAKAYQTYSTTAIKLLALEEKLADDTKMRTPAQLAGINAEIAETRAVQRQAAKELGVSLPDKAAAAVTQKNGWDSDSGAVFKDGKAIGVAKSAAEAKALHAKSGETAVPTKKTGEAKSASTPSQPLITRGPSSKNYPGGEFIWNGPTLPNAPPDGGTLDPKRNWPNR